MSGLRLVSGAISMTLEDTSAGIIRQVRYGLTTPDIDAHEVIDPTAHGGAMPAAYLRNVTESAELFFDGGAAQIQAAMATMNRLFDQARRYQAKHIGQPVYIEMRSHDGETWWRSEVLSGRAMVQEDKPFRALRAGYQILTLAWIRRYYWEGQESYLTLSNTNGTSSGGLTIQNTNDAGRDHYVDIAAGAITGDLPTPCRIELNNTTNATPRMGNVYIAHAAVVNPDPGYVILEGEQSTGIGSTSSFAGLSNGASRLWSGTGTGETIVGRWTLTAAHIQALAGAIYRVILTGNPSGSPSVQLRVQIGSLSTLYQTPWQRITTLNVQDIGALPLPPYLIDANATMYPLDLACVVRGENAGSWSIELDALHLFPTEGWRVLRQRGYSAAYGVTLVDDQLSNTLYTIWSGQRLGNYIAYGNPIMLLPSIAQRLYFLHDTDTGSYDASRTSSVRLAYRPRRQTI